MEGIELQLQKEINDKKYYMDVADKLKLQSRMQSDIYIKLESQFREYRKKNNQVLAENKAQKERIAELENALKQLTNSINLCENSELTFDDVLVYSNQAIVVLKEDNNG